MREMDEMLQSYVKELSSLKGRREDAKKWAKELAEHISKCPVCERELNEEMRKALLDQKNSLVISIDSDAAKLDKSIKKLERELSESKREFESVMLASGKMAQYGGIDALVAKFSEQVKEHAKLRVELLREVDASVKEREKLNKEVGDLGLKLDSVKRSIKYETEIKESSESLEKKKKEIKGLDFDEKKLYALQEAITEESSALSDIKGKSESNERHIKSLETQIIDKMKVIASLDSMIARIESRRAQISSMNKFKTALVETEIQLRNSLVTSINALMQNIWSELYPYADYSSIRLTAKKDDYALEACVDSGGTGREWMEIDSIASGGERSVACLTMRIALAMVIVPNLRWLILDEPTHNIDENGISKFIEVLSSSLPRVIEQIFIITHDNALKNISSARVYQLDRNKDRNEYTSIAES
jgi:DNA repair exonuclease SbcCD ATPase subunit